MKGVSLKVLTKNLEAAICLKNAFNKVYTIPLFIQTRNLIVMDPYLTQNNKISGFDAETEQN